MAYIGREPQVGNFQVCDAISVVNGQAAYTMQVGSVNVSPETANHMLVSLNGVLQAPGSSYTVSGSTITFASNLVTGDVINFIHILGSVLDLGVPSDSTVSLAKLTATGTKNSTTFLRGDNTFAAAGGGKVLQAVQGTTTSTTSTSSTSFVVTGLTVDITPAATSSKILLMACGVLQGGGGVSAVSFFDDNNSEVTGTTNGIIYTEETGHRENVSFSFLHSPSSTNELTYKVCLKNGNGSATHFAGASTKATIIAIEIGA